MQNCQAAYFSETLFIVSHYLSEPLNYTAATNFHPSVKFKYLGPLAGSKDNFVHKNHDITAAFYLAPRFLTLYLSSKQLRASGALGLNISGRYLRAKERLEASWVSP